MQKNYLFFETATKANRTFQKSHAAKKDAVSAILVKRFFIVFFLVVLLVAFIRRAITKL